MEETTKKGTEPGDLIRYRLDLGLNTDFHNFYGIFLGHISCGKVGMFLWQDGRQSIELIDVIESI